MPRILVDAHIDIAYNALVLERDLSLPVRDIRLKEKEHSPVGQHVGTCMVSLPALLDGHTAVVGGSIFVSPAWGSWQGQPLVYHTTEQAHNQAIAQLDYYRRLADEDDRVALLETGSDLETVLASWEGSTPPKTPRLGIFVVMEGADPIRAPGELGWWVERGLRGVMLAWAAGSRYAGGNAEPGPLTDEGHKLLRAMAEYNLLLDLSHLWTEAAYEVLDSYPGPVAASHANPRAFVDSPRLLSDDLIRRIAGREGVIGVIPFNLMLDAEWKEGAPRLPLTRLAEAIDHICQVTGHADSVGLGSDLDGGFGLESVPEGLESIADLYKIGDLLLSRGYSEVDVAKIMHGNWLRVMQAVLSGF